VLRVEKFRPILVYETQLSLFWEQEFFKILHNFRNLASSLCSVWRSSNLAVRDNMVALRRVACGPNTRDNNHCQQAKGYANRWTRPPTGYLKCNIDASFSTYEFGLLAQKLFRCKNCLAANLLWRFN